MIKRPNELQIEDQKISTLIYGSPGVGKTTLAASAPNALLIDLDKGPQRVNARHRVPYIQADTYESLCEDLASPELAEFDTIILDTGGAFITLLQDYVMRLDPVNRTKSGTISQKGFGAVKAEFTQFMNRLKTILKKNIIYVFHSIEEKNKDGAPVQRLLCEGSAKNIVWQPCDFGVYLFKNGDKTFAGFTPTDEYFAKSCYGISGTREIPFGNNVKNDFLTRLFNEAKANIAADNEFFKAEKAQYEAAMDEGKALIAQVITPAQAMEFTGKVKAINHALTSLDELRALFKERLGEVGIEWDHKEKKYDYVKKADKPETAPSAPQNARDVKEPVPTENNAPSETAPVQIEDAVSEKESVSIEDFIAADAKAKGGKK